MEDVNGTAVLDTAQPTQEGTPAAARLNKSAAVVSKAAEESSEAAHKAKIKELEIRAKELEILEKQINIQDAQERVDERQLRRENIRQKAYTNGATLKDIAARETQVQKRCNHRKGGDGAKGIASGQGVSEYFAVIKHTMLTGDMWIRCQRCAKTWNPPIKKDYLPGGCYFENPDRGGYFGIEGYARVLAEYEAARNFQTNNKPSSSQQFQWSDNGAYAREMLRPTTLR